MPTRAPLWISLGACLAMGCQEGSRNETPATPSASIAAAPKPRASARGKPRPYLIPTGPRLAIEAGKGVGPIRIGATVATIERLMDLKCEVLTESACKYVVRAVEFELDQGVTVAIRVHRPHRPAGAKDESGAERTYGAFNGLIPPDVMFGMTIPGVQVAIGKPTRVEKVNDDRMGTRELHHYPGMVLEYDQVPGAAPLVLGGVRITKP